MPTSIEIRQPTDADLPPIEILLAASDPLEVDRVRANIDREFQGAIKIASNYDDLLERIARSRPQLVLLGRIDKLNYVDICQECHKIQAHLPIVLLSTQDLISDSFRKLVKTCGLTDAVAKDSIKLNQLLQTIIHPTQPSIQSQSVAAASQPLPPISGKMMLAGLTEIVAISNNYFGPLAQGNYWRKAHARIVDEFPFIHNWSADHFSKLDCDESILERDLNEEEIQSLRVWVTLFIEECDRIIVDFRTILTSANLSLPAQIILAKS
jgi:hypothetical protein